MHIYQIGEESTFAAAFDGTIGEERPADAWTLVLVGGTTGTVTEFLSFDIVK